MKVSNREKFTNALIRAFGDVGEDLTETAENGQQATAGTPMIAEAGTIPRGLPQHSPGHTMEKSAEAYQDATGITMF